MSLKDTLKAKSAGLGAQVDAEIASQGKGGDKPLHPRTAIGQTSAFQLAIGEKDERIAQLLAQLEGKGQMKVPVVAVSPNPWQPRRIFNEDEMNRLAGSIAEVGLIQPIVVRAKTVPSRDTSYELVAGERRLRAHLMLGQTEIQALIVEASDGDLALMALAENLDREDLTDYETSKAIRRVESEFPSKKRMAEAIGVGRQDLYKYLAFNSLPSFIIDDLEVDPKLLGRNSAEQLNSVIKAHGAEASESLVSLWQRVKMGDLDQTKLAGAIVAAIERGVFSRTERDIKKLFVGKTQAGSITRDASSLTVKIRAAALSNEKEGKLREFVQQLLAEPD